MGRMVRAALVIGAITALSPVHDRAGGAADGFRAEARTLATAAGTAVDLTRQIADLDPQTRKLVLEMAATGLARAAGAEPPRAQSR